MGLYRNVNSSFWLTLFFSSGRCFVTFADSCKYVCCFRKYLIRDISISSTRSPTWIETIPLKYEYGSELFFYVRIIQAESERKEKGSLKAGESNQSLSYQQKQYQQQDNFHESNDGVSMIAEDSVSNVGVDGSSPQRRTKNRGGYCFGTALFEVGDLLGSRNYTKVKRLKKGGWYVSQWKKCRALRLSSFLELADNEMVFYSMIYYPNT